MASWQAHLAVWILKRRLKPRLNAAPVRIPGGAGEEVRVRKLFTPPLLRVPKGVQIEAGQVGGVPGEWVQLDGRPPEVTLLYLHGGGYIACSAQTHRLVTAAYARLGFRVFAPNYRLAPEHRFPAAVEDALAVYRALLARAAANAIVVSGESAGGGLALAMMLALRDRSQPLPAAAALFSPWTDLAGTSESLRTNSRSCAMFNGSSGKRVAAAYLGDADPRNPLASPLYADLANLPPLLVHVGADETMLDDSRRLVARAREAGVKCALRIWPVVPHAWQVLGPWIPEARESLAEASGFLRQAAREDGG
jgi:epsilon-lactone hydrolase